MEINEFQSRCAKVVKTIDEKYHIQRDAQLSFAQLMEEVGELIQEIDKPRLRGKEIDQENLEGEFADVFLQLCVLADLHGVDLEKAVNKKIETLKSRGYLE